MKIRHAAVPSASSSMAARATRQHGANDSPVALRPALLNSRAESSPIPLQRALRRRNCRSVHFPLSAFVPRLPHRTANSLPAFFIRPQAGRQKGSHVETLLLFLALSFYPPIPCH